MAVGFVHGVMNTDNFNLTGETFDFGPYRFCATSDPNLTAAYFDEQGLYRFGRQPVQGLWALQQLAAALTPLADAEDLADALKAYEPAYQTSFSKHTLQLLGLESSTLDADLEFASTFYTWLTESQASWPQTFFDWFGGEASAHRASESPQAAAYAGSDFHTVRDLFQERTPVHPERLSASYFQQPSPVTLLYDDIETLWSSIAEDDDWSGFQNELDHIDEALKVHAPAST